MHPPKAEWRPQCCGDKWPNTCHGKPRESEKARGWGLSFGGENDNEQYVLRGMMWADNHWLFCDNKERMVCMVNDIIAELLELDMEPKTESLRWTSTHHGEEKKTSRVGNRGPRVGPSLQRRVRSLGIPFPSRAEGVSGCRPNVVQRHGWWVARRIHLLFEECTHENEMSKSSQPRL